MDQSIEKKKTGELHITARPVCPVKLNGISNDGLAILSDQAPPTWRGWGRMPLLSYPLAGEPARYIGESARSAYERGQEHLEDSSGLGRTFTWPSIRGWSTRGRRSPSRWRCWPSISQHLNARWRWPWWFRYRMIAACWTLKENSTSPSSRWPYRQESTTKSINYSWILFSLILEIQTFVGLRLIIT